MDESDVHDQIAQLEERIAALTEAIERCRKIAFAAKISTAAGATWFTLVLFRIVPFDPTAFVAALAAVLGGVVLLGSNATTWTQADTERHAAETTRADLIGRIELRVVGENVRRLH
jgi:hypothetical protein